MSCVNEVALGSHPRGAGCPWSPCRRLALRGSLISGGRPVWCGAAPAPAGTGLGPSSGFHVGTRCSQPARWASSAGETPPRGRPCLPPAPAVTAVLHSLRDLGHQWAVGFSPTRACGPRPAAGVSAQGAAWASGEAGPGPGPATSPVEPEDCLLVWDSLHAHAHTRTSSRMRMYPSQHVCSQDKGADRSKRLR